MDDSAANFVPAGEPPPGQVPNFAHPKDVYHTTNITIQSLCLVMMTLLFAVRVYVKVVIKRGEILLEDWFCGASWLLTMLLGLSFLVMTHYGEGYHLWELSGSTFEHFLMWLYISTILYIPAAFATKVTLLLMIARVFSVRRRVSSGLRWLCLAFAIIYLPIQCAKIFICRPISAYWKMTSAMTVNGANPKCLDQSRLFTADMIVAILADFVIFVIPIPLTLTMRLPGRVRMRIMFMLSVGGSALGVVVFKAFKTRELIPSADLTTHFSILSILSLLEPVIGHICACLPFVNILLERLMAPASSPNIPRGLSFITRARKSIKSVTTSSLGFDFWSKASSESRTGWTTSRSRTQDETTTRMERTYPRQDRDPELHELEIESPAACRLRPSNLGTAGFAELVDEKGSNTSKSKEPVACGNKLEERCDIPYPTENRKARSWDGVVSDGLEEWKPAGLGALESLHNQTAVRIKWLDTASR